MNVLDTDDADITPEGLLNDAQDNSTDCHMHFFSILNLLGGGPLCLRHPHSHPHPRLRTAVQTNGT